MFLILMILSVGAFTLDATVKPRPLSSEFQNNKATILIAVGGYIFTLSIIQHTLAKHIEDVRPEFVTVSLAWLLLRPYVKGLDLILFHRKNN